MGRAGTGDQSPPVTLRQVLGEDARADEQDGPPSREGGPFEVSGDRWGSSYWVMTSCGLFAASFVPSDRPVLLRPESTKLYVPLVVT